MASKNLPAEALAEWRRVVPPLAGIVETVRANLATIAVCLTATTQEEVPMPRVCTICTHAERDAIDRALIEAAPMRRIAAEHSLAETSVRRHSARHLPTTLVLAAEAGEVMRAGSLLERARAANAEAWEVLNMAKQAENPGAVLQALDRIAKLLLVEGQFLATEGPADRYMVMTWEDPEPTPCKKCGYLEP